MRGGNFAGGGMRIVDFWGFRGRKDERMAEVSRFVVGAVMRVHYKWGGGERIGGGEGLWEVNPLNQENC